MTDNDNDQRAEDAPGSGPPRFVPTSPMSKTRGGEGQLFGAEALPQGSPLLVVKRGPNAGARFLLDRATTTAGRHPNSDIFLDDITVSRRHAQFRCVSGEFQVIDVGSLNGTYVNREPVDSALLANGDEVQIGKFRLLFLTGPTTGNAASVTG
jgi:pSer/pThr/pTyr-binding forkhead associated (FHA) protein